MGGNLEEKIEYMNVFRESNKPIVQDQYREDPKFQYFKQCVDDHEVVLPVLEYVKEKTLCL